MKDFLKSFGKNLLIIISLLIWLSIIIASVLFIIVNVEGMFGIILAAIVVSIEMSLSMAALIHFAN